MSRIELHLTDGRILDLSDLTLDEIVAKLDAEHVTGAMVQGTYHYLSAEELPSITCPRCGATSYNRHDVAQRYCGHCHQFHQDLEP